MTLANWEIPGEPPDPPYAPDCPYCNGDYVDCVTDGFIHPDTDMNCEGPRFRIKHQHTYIYASNTTAALERGTTGGEG